MKPIIFGHRGVPLEAPENSLKGFSLIKEYSIQGVELDIHLTKDNQLVVHHDFNTIKTTGKDFEISETDYKTLSCLDIGDGERIPKLEEVFKLLERGVIYDLEIKSRGLNRVGLCSCLLDLIRKYNLAESVFISSFDPVILRVFNRLQRASNLSIKTGIIYSRDTKPYILTRGLGLFLTKNSIIKPEKTLLKGFWIWFYRKVLKNSCYTWTLDSEEDWLLAEKIGLNGICTNKPVELLKFQSRNTLSN